MTRRHLVLVGLPGSGKTTAGQLVATTLGAEFLDVDAAIEARAGRCISDIFDHDGEAAFRRLEQEEVRRALDGSPKVIAVGGGWGGRPGRPAGARARALIVYLRTEPGVAARRVAETGGRPLLEGGDAGVRMRGLLAEREPGYRAAEATVETRGLDPETVAARVVALARTHGGW